MIDNSIFDLKVSQRPSCQWLITHSLVLETEAESTEMSRIVAHKWFVTWRSNLWPCQCKTSMYRDLSSKKVSLIPTRTATLCENLQLKMIRAHGKPIRSNYNQSTDLTYRSCDKSSASAWKTNSLQTSKRYNQIFPMYPKVKESRETMPLSRRKVPKLNLSEVKQS